MSNIISKPQRNGYCKLPPLVTRVECWFYDRGLRTKGGTCVPCAPCTDRIAFNVCLPRKITSRKLTQPHGVLSQRHAAPRGLRSAPGPPRSPSSRTGADGARDRIRYLVDPASSHMLVSKTKPCKSKYKQFIRRNCRWLIKTVIVYLMVYYYLDNRSNSRANTCTKAQLTAGCIY